MNALAGSITAAAIAKGLEESNANDLRRIR